MTQASLLRPPAEFNLRDKGRLYEDEVLSLQGHAGCLRYELVERRPKGDGVSAVKSGAHGTDIDQIRTASSGEQETAESATCDRGDFIADVERRPDEATALGRISTVRRRRNRTVRASAATLAWRMPSRKSLNASAPILSGTR